MARWTKYRYNSLWKFWLAFGTMLLIISYFSMHFYGNLATQNQQQKEIALLKKELEALTVQRYALQKETNFLKNGSLAKEVLDEYGRQNLSLSRENELTILLPKR